MYITCQNCQARYVVQASQIGSNGRKVKCTQCSESWFQAPADEAEQKIVKKIQDNLKQHMPAMLSKDEPVAQQPIVEQSCEEPAVAEVEEEMHEPASVNRNLPILVERPQILFAPSWLKYSTYCSMAASIILMVAIHSETINRYVPGLEELYQEVGIYSTEDLSLEKVDVVTIPQITGENEMIIKGVLQSQADKVRRMNLHISLYDKDQNKIAEHPIYMEEPDLAPFEKSLFRIPIVMSELPEAATHIALDIGNRLEQHMR